MRVAPAVLVTETHLTISGPAVEIQNCVTYSVAFVQTKFIKGESRDDRNLICFIVEPILLNSAF